MRLLVLSVVAIALGSCATIGRAPVGLTATELHAAMVRSLPTGRGGNCTPPRNVQCTLATTANHYNCTYELSYSPNQWQASSGVIAQEAGWVFKRGDLSCNFHVAD